MKPVVDEMFPEGIDGGIDDVNWTFNIKCLKELNFANLIILFQSAIVLDSLHDGQKDIHADFFNGKAKDGN